MSERLDLPACVSGAHHRFNRLLGQRQSAQPRPKRGPVFLIRLLVEQVIGFDINRALTQAASPSFRQDDVARPNHPWGRHS